MDTLTWEPLGYDETSVVATLCFADVEFAWPYVVYPCPHPEHPGQAWGVDYVTAEIGRYETAQEARAAAEDHMKSLE